MARETVTSENREAYIAKKMGKKAEKKMLANTHGGKEKSREWHEANPYHRNIEAHKHSSEAFAHTQTALEKENYKNHFNAANAHQKASHSWTNLGKDYEHMAKEHRIWFENHKGNLASFDKAHPEDSTVIQ